MNIFSAMKPDKVCKSVYDIPLDELKKAGKTCLLLDFDNTLGPDHAKAPDKFAYDFIKKITCEGFVCCLVSNAKSGRSAGIAKALDIPCITYAHKPRPDGVYRALKLMQTDKDRAVMVGDQVFTDVIAGRLAGVYTIMVEKYSPKEIWYVVLKRPFERLVRLIGRF
ncbi:MAG: YqeG family HAD IIIA-type phosphatase [Saccharofermentans sp.]|nr:YqeG family HAD IIIA-type phosphatase [Saccharofermentans sp.]